jgi:hypothetical protein
MVVRSSDSLRQDYALKMETRYQRILLSLLLGIDLNPIDLFTVVDTLRRLGDVTDMIKQVCGNDILEKTGPIVGLDDEGELQGPFRNMGIPGLWVIIGEHRHSSCLTSIYVRLEQATLLTVASTPNTLHCVGDCFRIRHSPDVCTEIKAIEEDVYGPRYAQ